MKTVRLLTLGLAAALLLCARAGAEVVLLKDGLVFKGRLKESGKDSVVLETFKGEVTLPKSLIRKMDKTRSPYELYAEERKKLEGKESDADAQFKLGTWCRSKKIWHKAVEHLKKALELNPEVKGGRKALEDAEKGWTDERRKAWIGFTLKIGVVTDMTREDMEKLTEVLKACSEELARSTGGLMYLKEVTLTANSRDGEMLYDPNQSDKEVPGSANNFSHGRSNWHCVCILHEFGHFKLGLADEYDTSIYGIPPASKVFCPKCKMSFPQKPPGEDWCSSLNHPAGAGNTPGCQETLIAQFGRQSPLLAEAFNWSPEEVLPPPPPRFVINAGGRR